MDDGLKMWLLIGLIAILILVLGPPALYYFSLWLGIWFGVKTASIIITILAVFSIIGGAILILALLLTWFET